jgi:uncharacterized protein (DUF1810 family)
MPTLDRFKLAQSDPLNGFDVALRELEAGRKRSHWIWYIFPQLAGLGASAMSARYGIRNLEEAAAYLADAVLRRHLLAATRTVATHLQKKPDARLTEVMGSDIDARKLVSSMTLFREVARRVRTTQSADEYADLTAHANIVLGRAAEQGIPACEFTLERLGIR